MEGDRKCGEQSCDDGRRLKSVHRREERLRISAPGLQAHSPEVYLDCAFS